MLSRNVIPVDRLVDDGVRHLDLDLDELRPPDDEAVGTADGLLPGAPLDDLGARSVENVHDLALLRVATGHKLALGAEEPAAWAAHVVPEAGKVVVAVGPERDGGGRADVDRVVAEGAYAADDGVVNMVQRAAAGRGHRL